MARKNKLTPKAAAQPSTLESKIERFKDSLFQSAQATTPLLTGCYTNWLHAQLRAARRYVNSDVSTKAQNHLDHTAQAWERAQALFAQLTPIVLDELVTSIAAQIATEYENIDAITASDVSSALRNVDLFDMMEHIN